MSRAGKATHPVDRRKWEAAPGGHVLKGHYGVRLGFMWKGQDGKFRAQLRGGDAMPTFEAEAEAEAEAWLMEQTKGLTGAFA